MDLIEMATLSLIQELNLLALFVSYVFPFTSPSNPGFWKKILVKTLFKVIIKKCQLFYHKWPKNYSSPLTSVSGSVFIPTKSRILSSCLRLTTTKPNSTALQWAEIQYNISLPCAVVYIHIEHHSSHQCTAVLCIALHGNILSCSPSHYVYFGKNRQERPTYSWYSL